MKIVTERDIGEFLTDLIGGHLFFHIEVHHLSPRKLQTEDSAALGSPVGKHANRTDHQQYCCGEPGFGLVKELPLGTGEQVHHAEVEDPQIHQPLDQGLFREEHRKQSRKHTEEQRGGKSTDGL